MGIRPYGERPSNGNHHLMNRKPRQPAKVWDGLGVNCTQPSEYWFNYTEETGAPFIPPVVNNFKRVRIFCDIGTATSRTAVHKWALQLKQANPDIHILYGGTKHPLTPDSMDGHKALVLEEAAWAMENGMDEFQVSNELENNLHPGLTDAQIRVFVREMADEVKQIFTRPISYAVAQGREDGWIGEGMGTLDRLSFNIYGHSGVRASFIYLCKKVYGAFGNKCFLSEWNLHPTWMSTVADGLSPGQDGFEQAYAKEVLLRRKVIEEIGFTEAYFFTMWSFAPSFGIDYFALWKRDEGYRAAFLALMSKKGRTVRKPTTQKRSVRQ